MREETKGRDLCYTFLNQSRATTKHQPKTRGRSPDLEKMTPPVTHVVMAQHDSFWVSSGSRCVDERAALVGPQAVNHSIKLLIGHIFSELHELVPLQKHAEFTLNPTPVLSDKTEPQLLCMVALRCK